MFSDNFIKHSKWPRAKLKSFYNEFFRDDLIEISEDLYSDGTNYDSFHRILEVSFDWDASNFMEGLIHEMAHIAEISNDRLLMPNYGFGSYRDGYQCKPAFERELRVFAYENAICKYVNKRFERETMSFGMEMVVAGSSLYSFPYNLVEQRSIIRNEFPKYKKIYNIEKFKEEWNKKIELLKNRKNI